MFENTMMLEAYLPEFSGLSSPAWSELLWGPRQRAAEHYASSGESDRRLDREDFMKTFAEACDYAKQCSAIAKSFCDIFGIHLALKLGIPDGVRFERYEDGFDRIVALVPLPTVKRIIDFSVEKRHRSLDGLKPSDFEPLDEFMPELGDRPNAEVARCLRLLDPSALSTLLRAFTHPSIEKTAIRAIARDRAKLAFSESTDWDKWRAAVGRRRREKYPRRPVSP